MESTADKKVIKLTALDRQIKESLNNKKNCLIFDKNGNSSVFFRYQAT